MNDSATSGFNLAPPLIIKRRCWPKALCSSERISFEKLILKYFCRGWDNQRNSLIIIRFIKKRLFNLVLIFSYKISKTLGTPMNMVTPVFFIQSIKCWEFKFSGKLILAPVKIGNSKVTING